MENFRFIMAAMRSGSSLLGHILSHAGWVNYAGETHLVIKNKESLEDIRQKIKGNLMSRWVDKRPFCDKVLHEHYLAFDNFLDFSTHVERIYILLRHPIGTLGSLYEANFEIENYSPTDYLQDIYKKMFVMLDEIPRKKFRIFDYYQLTDKDFLKETFGVSSPQYDILPTTGVGGWGDLGDKLKSGVVRRTTLGDDIEKYSGHIDLKSDEVQKVFGSFKELCSVTQKMELCLKI